MELLEKNLDLAFVCLTSLKSFENILLGLCFFLDTLLVTLQDQSSESQIG